MSAALLETAYEVLQGGIHLALAALVASRRTRWLRVAGGTLVALAVFMYVLSLGDLALIGDALPGGMPTPAGVDPTRSVAVAEYGTAILSLAAGWIVGRRLRLGLGDARRVFLRFATWYGITAVLWAAATAAADALAGPVILYRARFEVFATALVFLLAIPYGLHSVPDRAVGAEDPRA